MGGASWQATASGLRGDNGGRYRYVCPGGGRLGAVWGTNTYTDDSSVCTAATQVGLVNTTEGGRVTIEVRPGQDSYKGFSANGVTSNDYGSYPGAPFTRGTVPFNKTVDVTERSVTLKTATGSLKVTPANGATAAFVLVRGTENKKPIIELRLAKGDFSACPTRKTRSGRAAMAKVVRQLWGSGRGSFRTKGRFAAATVRGTNWLTSDRCDGTLTRVTRGVVQVADFKKRKTVTVRAGKSHLAKP